MNTKQNLRDLCEEAYKEFRSALKNKKSAKEVEKISNLIDEREQIYWNYIYGVSNGN